MLVKKETEIKNLKNKNPANLDNSGIESDSSDGEEKKSEKLDQQNF